MPIKYDIYNNNRMIQNTKYVYYTWKVQKYTTIVYVDSICNIYVYAHIYNIYYRHIQINMCMQQGKQNKSSTYILRTSLLYVERIIINQKGARTSDPPAYNKPKIST